MTNKEAYETLTANRYQWDRVDETHIAVWTSGYVTHEAHSLERYLMHAGMRLIKQEFDKACGKTCNVFKHK